MKLLSRLISLPTVLKLFRVGTYAPAHGVTEKPPCATAGATPTAPSRATNAMPRNIGCLHIRTPPYLDTRRTPRIFAGIVRWNNRSGGGESGYSDRSRRNDVAA